MGTKKYKSLFILHVYKFEPCKKPAYRIDKEDVEQKGYAEPGFNIFESDTGFFESLVLAEKQIQKHTKEVDTYGFIVEEKPMGGMFYAGDALSRRRYLKNGKLWQECDVSGIRYFNGKHTDLGNTEFHGRDLKAIPFKEGDIVEIAGLDFVRLAIIWSLPPSLERMKEIWAQHKSAFGKKLRIHPDQSDDTYTVAYYNVEKDGEIGYGHTYPAVVDVLPPSLPVPRKIATELRTRLKMLQDESEQDKNEYGNDIPF